MLRVAIKEIAQVTRLDIAIAHAQTSLDKRMVGKQREKTNSIKEVRLADAIRSGDTGKRAKINGHTNQVFEPIHFETCQHRDSPSGGLLDAAAILLVSRHQCPALSP
jgi:hypothetical protein